MTDVKKESKSNVKFCKICTAVRKNNLWYLYNSKSELMSSEGWAYVEVIENYVITTDKNGKFFFHFIQDNTLFSCYGNVDKIEPIKEDYFVVTHTTEKALYKGRTCLIDYDEYVDFQLNFDFNVIIIVHEDGFELADFTGKRLINGMCDDIQFCPTYSNSGELIKFLRFGKWGIYKLGKGIIIEPKMHHLNVYSNYIEAILANKKGVYNFEGDEIIPIKYVLIRLYGNKVFKVAEKKGNKYVYGAWSINGIKILEAEYGRVNVDLEKDTVEGEKIIRRVVKRISR